MSEDPQKSRIRAENRMITVRGAREHNLKNVDLAIPRDQLVVFTGLSGSGKSSLAFDTIYAEGQRRYVESLSAYARQFLEMMQKPDVDQIDGLSPAISIEQKTTSKNPRSTVGTVTEIYDYMRLLWARVGVPYSPATGLPIESQTVSQMADRILALPEGTRLYLMAPVVRGRKGEFRKDIAEWMKRGYQRLKIDGKFYEIAEAPALDKKFNHDIDVVVDRIVVRADIAARLADSLEQCLKLADGLAVAEFADAAAATTTRDRQEPRPVRPGAHPVLGEVRLPGLRIHHPGDRAAAVLVQQSVRGVSGLRRARHRTKNRRRSGDPRQGRDLAQGRDRAVGALVLALLHPDASGARQAFQVHARHQVEGPAAQGAGHDALWIRRDRHQVRLRRRHARLRDQEAVRGRGQQSRAPLARDRERMGARGNLQILHRHSLRRLHRLPAQARGAVRQGRRAAYRRGRRTLGQARQ